MARHHVHHEYASICQFQSRKKCTLHFQLINVCKYLSVVTLSSSLSNFTFTTHCVMRYAIGCRLCFTYNSFVWLPRRTYSQDIEFPNNFTPELRDCLEGLLHRDVDKRLGCRPGGHG